MKKKKSLKIKDPVDVILNGKPKMKDHPNHIRALAIKTPKEEKFTVENPITGKKAEITLSRQGTTDEKLAMIMLSPDATKEQKDSMLATYIFERGRENTSFLMELYISKGTLVRETQAFKKQIRFDLERFADMVVGIFQDMANDVYTELKVDKNLNGGVMVPKGGDIKLYASLFKMAQRLEKGAELITKQREAITEARMREKGYGIYLDKNGQAFSIYDSDIEEVVHKEKEEIKKEQEKKADEQMARRPKFIPKFLWRLFIKWFFKAKRI